jgi:Cu+-exporting ATPase
VATLVGLALGAKRGIVFKRAAHIETMAKATMIVLDKTGTITQGKPEVLNVECTNNTMDMRVLYALVGASKHPVSRGVARYIEQHDGDISQISLEESKEIPARGVVARHNGVIVAGGNGQLMKDMGIDVATISDNTLFYYAVDGQLMATFELRDTPKAKAKESIEALKKMGLRVVMLTGDHEKSANVVAGEVGIDEVYAHLTPQAKGNFVQEAHHEGHVVVMAGDGVNDLLALASADIGIAMGSGSDIAIEVSDVIILNDSLVSLVEAVAISRRTYGLIKQNLGISLVYNSITIPLAMAGYIIPLIAAISMSFSSLLVVGNSMRSRWMYK